MDESLINSNQAVSAAAVEIPAKKTEGKAKNFFLSLFFGLAGSIILALMDLLFVAMANSALDFLVSVLVIFGPAVILGLYIYFLVRYFKTRRFIFYGLLASFIIFLTLFIIIIISLF